MANQPGFLSSFTKQTPLQGAKKPLTTQLDPEMLDLIREMSRRLRTLEERNVDLRKNLRITEQNMITHNKDQSQSIATLTSEIDDMKKEIGKYKEQMEMIIRELKEAAKKDDVAVLQKYISFWEPLNFVTRSEVEKIARRIFEENKKKSEGTNTKSL